MKGILTSLMIATASVCDAAPERFASYDLTHLDAVDTSSLEARRRAWDELHLVSAVQGLANREKPRLYVYWVGDRGGIDRYWMGRLREEGRWLHHSMEQPVANLDALLAQFRGCYQGLVVWDEAVPATSNVASTAAGAADLLPVRYDASPDSLYTKLTREAKLPVVVSLVDKPDSPIRTLAAETSSAKCRAYLWAVKEYLASGKCKPSKMGYYPDAFYLGGSVDVPLQRTLLSNHDYFIAQRGFIFDLMPWEDDVPRDDPSQAVGDDFRTLQAILKTAYAATQGREMIHMGGFVPWDHKYTDYTGEKYGGVATEWRLGEILSCYNGYMDADAPGLNAMANASFFQHFPLKAKYPQANIPTVDDLRKRGLIGSDDSVTSKAYVTVYVGDYDAAAWLYQRMPDLWDDPARGSIPLGWAFNPNLADRFPVGMDYTRETASPNDTFVCGDCGAGYLNPGYLTPPRRFSDLPSGLDLWEKHCTKYFQQWDLSLTGFVIDGFAPEMTPEAQKAYTRFSPRGVVTQYSSKRPRESMIDGVPFLRMEADLDRKGDENAKLIAETAPAATSFSFYRTILWSPTRHKELFEAVRKLRPDVEFVEPHTLMALMKHHKERKDRK